MPCNAPIRGHRQADGSLKLGLGPSQGPGIEVSCGWCMGCRIRRTQDWANRMMHEAQLWPNNSFVTLTYDNDNLPEDRSLDVRHFQLFMKRLREKRRPQRIRFYHCGEYGPKTLRPHYHAALFNCGFPDQVKIDGGSKSGEDMWSSAELTETWAMGLTTVQPLTFETAAYVSGYIIGKVEGKSAQERAYERVDPETGEVWQVRPEYSTMSRGGRGKGAGGIGTGWFQKFESDVYPHDYVVRSGGVKMSPPRFYDSKLSEEQLLEIKTRREERGKARRMTHDTPRRREAREEITRARIGLRNRDL